LILKPNPTRIIAKIRYLSLPFSAAIDRAQHARSRKKTSILSTVLFLLTATKTGVTAKQSAEISPAGVPKDRLTRRYRTITESTPAAACGNIMLQPLKPNIFAEIVWNQYPNGGLSMVLQIPKDQRRQKRIS
jgi:hypothetical protein